MPQIDGKENSLLQSTSIQTPRMQSICSRRAISTLRSSQLWVKGYHTEEDVVGYYNTGDRMKHWGKMGAFWVDSGACSQALPSS